MAIRIRVTQIDSNGYWGRAPHPPADLTGDGSIIGLAYDEVADEYVYRVRIDGPLLFVFDLLEHEFDVIGLSPGPLGIGAAGPPIGAPAAPLPAPAAGPAGPGPVCYPYQTGRAAAGPRGGWLQRLITKIRRGRYTADTVC